ncbi:hypothetical protein FLS06_22965, partial [Salmonella enterica subsp. enterica serovar Muenchen]
NKPPCDPSRIQLLPQSDRRYVALKSNQLPFPGPGESHAFCCIKYPHAIGINGNTAETQSTHYQPYPYDKVSIWGPFPHNLT